MIDEVGTGELVDDRDIALVDDLAYSLLSTEKVDGSGIAPNDQSRVDQFVAQVDPARLAGLKVEQVGQPRVNQSDNARVAGNWALGAALYGADEKTERLALITLGGREYAVGFTLLRYGADWKIQAQFSQLASQDSSDGHPTTRTEFSS